MGTCTFLDSYLVTCVNNGASNATFTSSNGETHVFDRFHIIVLRHDPFDSENDGGGSDIHGAPEGARDPTGPVFWLKLWAEMGSFAPR